MATVLSNMPMCSGWARSDWPAASSRRTTSPASSTQARPEPAIRHSPRPCSAGLDPHLHAGRPGHEAGPAEQVTLILGTDFDAEDAAGSLRRERDDARFAGGRVDTHPGLVRDGHLDRVGHPGESARLADNAFARVKQDRQHWLSHAKELIPHARPPGGCFRRTLPPP